MKPLKESIYGDTAVVYHRTPFKVCNTGVTPEEALQNEPVLFAWDHSDPSILESMEWGFKAGEGDYYGKGFYSVFNPDQINQLTGGNRRYGDILIKFRVLNISNYLFLDFDQFKKTTKYQGNANRYNEDNYIMEQLSDAGVPRAYFYSKVLSDYKYISEIHTTITQMAPYFDGLIYTNGERDGDVLIAYDHYGEYGIGPHAHEWALKGIWPLGFSLDNGSTWTRIPISSEIASLIRQQTLTFSKRALDNYKDKHKQKQLVIQIPEQNIFDFNEEDLQKNQVVLRINTDSCVTTDDFFKIDLLRPFVKYKPIVQFDTRLIRDIYTEQGGDLSPLLKLIEDSSCAYDIHSDALISLSETPKYKIQNLTIQIPRPDLDKIPQIYTDWYLNYLSTPKIRGCLVLQFRVANNQISVCYDSSYKGPVLIQAANTKGIERIPIIANNKIDSVVLTFKKQETDILSKDWILNILNQNLILEIKDTHTYTTWLGHPLINIDTAHITTETQFIGDGQTNVNALITDSVDLLAEALLYTNIREKGLLQCTVMPDDTFSDDLVDALSLISKYTQVHFSFKNITLEGFNQVTSKLSEKNLTLLKQWSYNIARRQSAL